MSSTELESKIRELRQLQSLIDEAQAKAETTPPGEEQPPVDVVKALVGEWSRKECL